ncbi:MAG: sulfate permease [Rhodothermales bacterium]
MSELFRPKLLTVVSEGYSLRLFRRDVTAGIIVGIVALPLAIAFAIASGVKPEQGLYTAIVAGVLISALGGSRVQIGGPTGAFVVIVYSIVQRFGYDGLALATILAGALLVAMGFARLGALIRYIPYPVTVGFTTGIAVIIASSQFRDALGLSMESVPAPFFEKWIAYYHSAATINPYAVAIAAFAVILIVAIPRFAPRVPASLIALLISTVIVAWLQLPVETIGTRFGTVSAGLPTLRFPNIELSQIPSLVSPALSIALLGGIESLLSAVVADGMTGGRHRSNTELIAQGIANIASPLFGGIPATGAIARTATNIKSGGITPVSGIVHALTLLLILVAAGKLASWIPMPALAAILVVVAWNMSELHLFRRILVSTRSDALILLSTFGLTVAVDLIVAIQVGVVLASLLFMKRMADVASIRNTTAGSEDLNTNRLLSPSDDSDTPDAGEPSPAPPGVEVYEIAGPFFFGAAHKFKSALSDIHRKPRVIILRMRSVSILDATGLRVLEEMQSEAERGGPVLVLSGIQEQPLALLRKSGFVARIGTESVCRSYEDAIEVAGRLAT